MALSYAKEHMVPEMDFSLISLDEMLSLFDAFSPCETHIETQLILSRFIIYRLLTNS